MAPLDQPGIGHWSNKHSGTLLPLREIQYKC